MIHNNSLKAELRRGVMINAAAKYSEYALSLVVAAILARLLSPEQFGTVAVVTVLLAFFKLVGDAGLGPAVIQRRDFGPEEHGSVFTLSAFISVAVSALFALVAPLVARVYSDVAYYRLVPAMALALLFTVGSVVPQAMLRKQKRFGALGAVMITSHVVGGATGILGALHGWGAMALVVKSIVSAGLLFLSTLILSGVSPKVRLQFDLYRSIARYSGFQFLFSFINYFSRNLDKLLIGGYLGQASLGFYEKSYRLMMLPLQTLTRVITPVLHPVLAAAQDQTVRVFRGFIRVSRLLAVIGFPLSVFLHFAAGELVLLIFGPQWERSIPVFSILASTVGLQMVLSSTGSIFQVAGRTDLLFVSGTLSAVFMVGGTVAGLLIGSTEAVALGLVCAFVVNFFQGTWMLIHFALNERFRMYLFSLVKPVIIATLLFGVLAFTGSIASVQDLSLVWSLTAKAGLSFLTFLVGLWLTGEYRELFDVFGR